MTTQHITHELAYEFARLTDGPTSLCNAAIQHYIDSQAVQQVASPDERMMAGEREAATAYYMQRITRVSERDQHGQSMYELGWWDRAWIGNPERKQIQVARLNEMWADALKHADPTAGNAHILFARAVEEDGK